MHDKFELFNILPLELQIQTAQNLSNPDLVKLMMTSKHHLALFKPMVDVRKLLHYVVRSEHDAVQSILKDNISLVFKRGKVTDCSGRTFTNISAFEYALWTLDTNMWALMLDCIPHNEEGKKIFAKLISQYDKINTDGLTYKFDGETITEKYFDFENTIIKQLQTQINLINTTGEKDWAIIDEQWRDGVGQAQKLLPMHVVYEYCSNEPFYPTPKFTHKPKQLKQFYNWTNKENENWFSADSKLGIDFAIYKGHPKAAVWASNSSRGVNLRFNLAAIKELCAVRASEFTHLKSQLEEKMSLDNHSEVDQMASMLLW